MLIGLLIMTLDYANRNNYVMVTVMFSILILMKHLFIPLTPLFAFYLLTNYYNTYKNNIKVLCMKVLGLVIIAILALLIAFLPFALQQPSAFDQLEQIFKRLFPWDRGLLHAYWAPNIWAIYCAIDICLSKLLNSPSNFNHQYHSSTSGLVGNFDHRILPMVPKYLVILILILLLIPPLILITKKFDSNSLMKNVIYTTFTMFMFGYHVHEKVIIFYLSLY